MRDIITPTDAALTAERLLTAVRGPVIVGEHRIEVTACIGIAPATGQDAQDLLRDATAAMRQAAALGPDRWEVLGGDIATKTRLELETRAGLRQAMTNEQIQAWFMPVVDLLDGRTCGYEALVRWIQQDGSVVAPVDFLDIAERSGVITAIDRIILSQGLNALDTMDPQAWIAVNVSAASMSSGDLLDMIRGELDRSGADPRRLHLEVTETALFRVTDAVQAMMQAVADLGVSWWVDDFGTGYSSISHLRDLPIAGLKLDLSFTQQITGVSRDRPTMLTNGLVGLAHGLGLATIAEGIETRRQANILIAQGWTMGQGWLYGKAAPAPGASA
ncbi:MAG: GGDEF domain-containing phosphodiesterase, partial [Actinomycetes bacterium]